MKEKEYAKEVGVETIALMDKIRGWEMPVKSHMASLTEEQVESIKTKLAEETSGGKKKTTKKVVKKKVAKKKVAKKKVAKKVATKKITTKKTATKKASSTATKKVVKKKVVKKAVTKKATTTTKKKTVTKKTASTKSTVIRRKAADLEAQAKAAEEAAKAAEEAQELGIELDEDSSVVAATETTNTEHSGKTENSAEEKRVARRNNIVGKMDLSTVRRPQPRSTGGNTPSSTNTAAPATGAARTAPARNIRTGFVGPAPMIAVDNSADKARKEREEKKKRAGAGGGKDQPVQSFVATDFRKREIIFQPKKKRVATLSKKKTEITQPKALKRVVKMQDTITVSELAQAMNIRVPQLTRKLMSEGVMAKMNTELDFDTVSLIVNEFNYEVQNVRITDEDLLEKAAFGELEAEEIPRAPVVTVMGHVDHGKTTLLDAIRNADVASGEAGGITQHIGAYSVKLEDGSQTTFIDTPGHAAFTAMRARGASATDIVIVVVAADDGMMPQTEEAISHAQAAGVPIIVAVNKMDKEGANADKIKQQLSEKELVPEDWGGDTIFAPVSALKKEGIKELLESVHLVAEVLELKSNPKRSGTGIIVESKMEKGKGNVATVLVQDGTVKVGEAFVAGKVVGRIRRMTNDKGELVKTAGPGVPVEITGLANAPAAGDRFDLCKSDDLAKEVAELRKRQTELSETPNSKMSLDDIFSKVKSGDLKELNIVLKADVVGSIEAIKGLLAKLGNDEVKTKIIHTGVGLISENDVLLAGTAGGLVVGFNVKADTTAQRVAKERGVEIKSYSVIYNLGDDIKAAMAGLLDPDIVEEELGAVEVRDIFSVPKLGVIAGCYVTDGKVKRNSLVRLSREGKIVYSGKICSLKRFKDDAKEVLSGYECGLGIENYSDIKVGDIIQAYETKEVARTLE